LKPPAPRLGRRDHHADPLGAEEPAARPAKATKKRARGNRPENPITKTEMWCRPHNRMHPRSEFAPSFIKRQDFRCKAAFKAAYGAGAKPKAAKKGRKK